VCFADCKSSSVDIVQYIGRCLRKYYLIPDKISYVLVPFIMDNDNDFYDYNNQSYVKLRKILKTIGTTDDMITEKFELIDCNKNNYEYIDKCENTYIQNSKEFNIEQFKNTILTRVFDKAGNIIDIIRNKLIFENKN
jgi:predicted helicase